MVPSRAKTSLSTTANLGNTVDLLPAISQRNWLKPKSMSSKVAVDQATRAVQQSDKTEIPIVAIADDIVAEGARVLDGAAERGDTTGVCSAFRDRF